MLYNLDNTLDIKFKQGDRVQVVKGELKTIIGMIINNDEINKQCTIEPINIKD